MLTGYQLNAVKNGQALLGVTSILIGVSRYIYDAMQQNTYHPKSISADLTWGALGLVNFGIAYAVNRRLNSRLAAGTAYLP